MFSPYNVIWDFVGFFLRLSVPSGPSNQRNKFVDVEGYTCIHMTYEAHSYTN